MLRFIHGADLHFDRSFEGVKGLSESATKRLLTANQTMLTNIVAAAVTRQVDFVLLAGDTFHQARSSLKAQGALMAALRQLEEAQIPVYLCFGNHDYFDEKRYWFSFPENVHLFKSDQVTSFTGETASGEGYQVAGFSYLTPHLTGDLLERFPPRGAVDYMIGMYHGDPQGQEYAPFSVGRMKDLGYDYWALGHIHVPTLLSQQPPIVYPGTPQPHTRKETTGGYVTYVELTPGDCQLEQVPVAGVFWQQVTVPATGMQEQKQLLRALEEALAELDSEKETLVELKIVGGAFDRQTMNALTNGELQQYLNEQRTSTAAVQIAALTVVAQEEETTKPSLDATLTTEHLAVYQNQEVFQELVADLLDHPIAGLLLRQHPEYQEMVLQQAWSQLAADFTLEEGQP